MKFTTLTAVVAALSLTALVAHAEDGKALYEKSCAACHGKDGAGATAMGKKLQLKDYTDAKVQASMKDEEMTKAIKEGVSEGGKSKMKAFGDKLTDGDIKAIVAHIRSLKK